MKVLTNSSARTFRRCSREYRIRYRDGYGPIARSVELDVGVASHSGLEAWCIEVRAGHGSAGFLAARDALPQEMDPFERARVTAMLLGYHARWLDAPVRIVEVELEFAFQMPNPDPGDPAGDWIEAGKLDGIVEVDGELLVLEHKTSREDIGPGSDYRDRLVLDSQLSVYMSAARQLGHDVKGVLYDVLKKPELRPLKANTRRAADETPDEFFERCCEHISAGPENYYQRFRVSRLDSELRAAAIDRWHTAGALDDAIALGRWPRNTDSCIRFRKRCAYWDVCNGSASLDDPTRFVKLERLHSELTIERPEEEGSCNRHLSQPKSLSL